MILISLCASCASPPRTDSFIRSSYDPDTRLEAVERQIGYLQSKLGVQSYHFNFATPPDKRLVATFIAEMNGEMLPDLSGEFHIPPTDSARGNPGQIWVTFFEPKYQTGASQGPLLELEFQHGRRRSYLHNALRDLSRYAFFLDRQQRERSRVT